MHRHRNSHGIRRSLSECCCAAANEKSPYEPGGKPETFHDSDELTNFAAEAQHNVRQCACSENRSNPQLPLLRKSGEPPLAELTQFTGKSMKIFIDHLPWRWLKVVSSGVKWAIAPRDNGRRFPTRTLLCRRVPAFH